MALRRKVADRGIIARRSLDSCLENVSPHGGAVASHV